jgi:hypothetical protein
MEMERKPLHAAHVLYCLFSSALHDLGHSLAFNLAKLGSSAARRKLAR